MYRPIITEGGQTGRQETSPRQEWKMGNRHPVAVHTAGSAGGACLHVGCVDGGEDKCAPGDGVLLGQRVVGVGQLRHHGRRGTVPQQLLHHLHAVQRAAMRVASGTFSSPGAVINHQQCS